MFVVGLAIFTAGSAAAALAPYHRVRWSPPGRSRASAARSSAPLTLTILSAAVPAERARPGARRLGRRRRPGRRARAARRRRRRRGPVLAVDLLDQRADRPRCCCRSRGGVSTRRTARTDRLDLPGLGLVSVGLLGDRLGSRARQRARLDEPRDRAARCRRRRAARRVRPLGASHAGADAADALLPQPDVRPANVASLLMFFGMFGSIFLLAQFFQVVQGYSPLQAGLRILPWTAMPIFVAPIAGALSDRIGASGSWSSAWRCRRSGSAGWPPSRRRPCRTLQLVRPLRPLRHRHGALLRTGRQRRARALCGARRRARPPAPTTPSARSAACSASPCSRRVFARSAATRRRRRSSTGWSPPCGSARRSSPSAPWRR